MLIVEELIDELHGACISSKLDLWLGYYKFRMVEENIFKITFRIHKDYYEFIAMPFSLTNALVTF